jgi:hypothetical protein
MAYYLRSCTLVHTMDMVREILQVMDSKPAVTVRHIAYRTGYAPSTLVGVMMGMISQGYILRTKGDEDSGDSESRCSCACCVREKDRESTTSLDVTLYQITRKGQEYLITWAGK